MPPKKKKTPEEKMVELVQSIDKKLEGLIPKCDDNKRLAIRTIAQKLKTQLKAVEQVAQDYEDIISDLCDIAGLEPWNVVG